MIRPFLFALICCLSLTACKNDTKGATNAAPSSNSTAPPTSSSQANTAKKSSAEVSLLESTVRNTICGIMIKTVDLKGGNLNIEYFKNADDYKSLINNERMNEDFFKKYWSTSSRTEKVMALVPSQILSKFDKVEQIDITIHTGEKTLSANINRDNLAQFVGQSWEEIQTDWLNLYRFVVVNNSKKRKEFFDQFVTIE